MRPKDIKVGKTYIGRDGKRRTVTHIFDLAGRSTVMTIDHDKDSTGMCDLSRFANWAAREDPSDAAMKKWRAEQDKRTERFLAQQRKEAKRKKGQVVP